MAQLVYLDETGSVGRGARKQPLLTLAAAIVEEEHVQPLAEAFKVLARKHLGGTPADFELHGNQIWNGVGHWTGMSPDELIAVYEDAIAVLDQLDVDIASSSIDKQRLHVRYGGAADAKAYLLALQFLVEKSDRYSNYNKILIADEAKELN